MSCISSRVKLCDGKTMPLFGLGCFRLEKCDINEIVSEAVKLGYRLFDTAILYGNEEEVAETLRASGLTREEYFIVTKIIPEDFSANESKTGLKNSLKRMKLDYVDLFLIHSPMSGGRKLFEVWRAFCEMKEEGLTKSIGVSNFNANHLQAFIDEGVELPAVNQIELHPWNQYKDTVALCDMHGIKVMGFCPLARNKYFDTANAAYISDLSEKYKRSKAQIVLRWAIQHQYITIPKSSKTSRIIENADIFDWQLTSEEMGRMDSLDIKLPASGASHRMDEKFLQN